MFRMTRDQFCTHIQAYETNIVVAVYCDRPGTSDTRSKDHFVYDIFICILLNDIHIVNEITL